MKLQSTLTALAKALTPLQARPLRSSIAAALSLLMAGLCQANAGEPCHWKRKPNDPTPFQFDTFHGETIDFQCTFVGFSSLPFAGSGDSSPRLYYQTNGMAAAWWDIPATVSTTVVTNCQPPITNYSLAATFPPSADPGAERLTVFFGAPSNAYAAAQVRFRNSPGAHPNDLQPPSVLDWQAELAAATNALWKSSAAELLAKADVSRTVVSTNSIIVPERIDGENWTYGDSIAGWPTGDLVRDAALTASATDGSIYWSAQTNYTPEGEGDLKLYRYAIAWYNPYTEIFQAAVWSDQSEPMPSVVADIGLGFADQVDDFRSVLGLPWPESFATLGTPEPDAVDWEDFTSIRLFGESTAYVPTQAVETVVYSRELAAATNALHARVSEGFLSNTGGVVNGSLTFPRQTIGSIALSGSGLVANGGDDLPLSAKNGGRVKIEGSSIYLNPASDGASVFIGNKTLPTYIAENSPTNGLATTNYAQTSAAAAVANADTTYRRTIGLTNLNQSVQYVNVTDTAPTTLAITMPTDGVTKDWMVYVVSVTNVTLSLPSATWWMADTAYTNDVPPATPTALWFSQVTDGIFILGRQELTEIAIP